MYKYISKKDYKLLDFSEDELNPLLTLVANLDNLTARHVMTSRLDILAIDKNAGFQHLKDIIRTNKYSRFPVYHENIDNLEGILYIKDLIPYLDKKDDFDWQFLLRNCYFIPEGKKLDELLKDFKEKQVHMAIVLDEYGGMAGLVTLEDIIEEIIGDIKDEYDMPKEIKYNKLDNKTYIFDASISISDFCYITGTDKKFFQISGSEINSINDLLMQLMIKIPKVGYHISFYKFNFTIIATGPEKILRVKTVIKDRKIEKKPA